MSSQRRGKGVSDHNSKSKKSTKLSQVIVELCKDCEAPIGDDSKALTRRFCHKWVCTKCLDIPDELYHVMSHNPTSHLLAPYKDCASQASSLHVMQQTITEIKENQDKINDKIAP